MSSTVVNKQIYNLLFLEQFFRVSMFGKNELGGSISRYVWKFHTKNVVGKSICDIHIYLYVGVNPDFLPTLPLTTKRLLDPRSKDGTLLKWGLNLAW